jgi:hypothetical protein
MLFRRKNISSILSIFLLVCVVSSKVVIWDEIISQERLETRIKTFNQWYEKFNPNSSKVEARLTKDLNFTRIGIYAKEDIKSDDVYLKLDRSKIIRPDHVYETPIGAVIKKLESLHGYDDYTNLLFYLLHEIHNKNSEWKPYIDLLPRQPTSIAYKYWERKDWIEDELLNTPILSNRKYLQNFIRKNC